MVKEVGWVCSDCGGLAHNVHELVYKKHIPLAMCSTYHFDTCSLCGERKECTEIRDFGYPDTRLVNWASVKRAIKKGER